MSFNFAGEFDMRVKSCVASDGGGHVIKLSDEYGCVLRPKMISRFLKARAPDEKATVITYAFFHAFKFPDALSVHIKCKVEICRHGCLDHCQATGSNERHDIIEQEMIEPTVDHDTNQLGVEPSSALDDDLDSENSDDSEQSFYDQIASAVGLKTKNNNLEMIRQRNAAAAVAAAAATQKNQQQHQHGPMIHQQHQQHQQHPQQSEPVPQAQQAEPHIEQHHLHEQIEQQSEHYEPQAQAQTNEMPPPPQPESQQPQQQPLQQEKKVPEVHEESIDELLPHDQPMHEMLRKTYLELKKAQDEKFPHGPRQIKDRMGLPPVAGPRSLNLGEEFRPQYRNTFVAANRTIRVRHRRSIVISDRKARSADVGVTGIYDVISEADLQFPNDEGKQEPVTVFQGKISEEVVYGICMPVPGFSVLFILVTSATVVSALVAGSLLYRYQLQKVTFEAHQQNAADVAAATATGHINPNTFASWMTLRLFRMNQACEAANQASLSMQK